MKYQNTLYSLIALSKAKKENKVISIYKFKGLRWSKKNPNYCYYNNKYMNIYIFEVKYLKPLIRKTKNKIKLLKYRKQRLEDKIAGLEYRMKMIHFKKDNYIKITGRAQGKYCNNLFKYDHKNNMMTYIDTSQNKITFHLDFPYRKEELIRVLELKHSAPGKAVCYTLVDKGEYFIICASIELDIRYNDYLMDINNGTVGIDINNDHIALSETDRHGNLIYSDIIGFHLTNKSTNQRNWIIENTVNKVLDYCVKVNKPLIIEELNFEKKKKEFRLYDKDKKYHRMLSEFSYRKIIEKLYSRSYKVHIGIHEVKPEYTSIIGKIKYSKMKGLSVHRCASYVIARRGMGYKERLPKALYGNINLVLNERWKNYNILLNH